MDKCNKKVDEQQQTACDCEASVFYKKYKRQIERIFTKEKFKDRKSKDHVEGADELEGSAVSSTHVSGEEIDTTSEADRPKKSGTRTEDFGQIISPSKIVEETKQVTEKEQEEYIKRVQAKEKSLKKKRPKISVVPAQTKKGQTSIPDWLLSESATTVEDEQTKQITSEPLRKGRRSDQERKSRSDAKTYIKEKKQLLLDRAKGVQKEEQYYVDYFDDDDDGTAAKRFQRDLQLIQDEVLDQEFMASMRAMGKTSEEQMQLLEERRKSRIQAQEEAQEDESIEKAVDLSKLLEKITTEGEIDSEAHEIRKTSKEQKKRVKRMIKKKSRVGTLSKVGERADETEGSEGSEGAEGAEGTEGKEGKEEPEKIIEEEGGEEYFDEKLDEREGIYQDEQRLSSEIPDGEAKVTFKSSEKIILSRKSRALKSLQQQEEGEIVKQDVQKEQDLQLTEQQPSEGIVLVDREKSKSVIRPIALPPHPKMKKDTLKIVTPKAPKHEIQTILKPRSIKSEDTSTFITHEKEVVPIGKKISKGRDELRSVKQAEQELQQKVSAAADKHLTEILVSETPSTAGYYKFKRPKTEEEKARKKEETRRRLRLLELSAEGEEGAGIGLHDLSKFDLGSQDSYDSKADPAKKKAEVAQLEELKITANTHYAKYLSTHKVDELFHFLGTHLVASAPDNPVFFLISLLDSCLKYRSNLGAPPLVFQPAHVESLYYSMDAMKEGFITIEQYHTGMKTMNIEYYNWTPELDENGRVSKDTFINEAVAQQKILLNDLIKPHDTGSNRPRMSEVSL